MARWFPTKTPKYKNRKVVVDGLKFDSAAEGKRYLELKMLAGAGEITGLVLQPKYPCLVNGVKVCVYVADFRYYDNVLRTECVEDVKGFRTKDYILKKKLAQAVHGIEVIEVYVRR